MEFQAKLLETSVIACGSVLLDLLGCKRRCIKLTVNPILLKTG